MWISGSFKKDLLVFHLSGFLGLMIFEIIKGNGLLLAIYGLFLTQVLDAGHNYITFWRTFFKRANNIEKIRFAGLFLFCFLIIFLWIYLKIPYFWTFFIYFTFFHHIRQYYGINRWYQKLNSRYCKYSLFFLYTLTITPFVLFHFRNFPPVVDFKKVSLLQYPHQNLLILGLIFYFILIIFWIFHESQLLKKGDWEMNRFLSILMPATLHGFCFLLSTQFLQILFPLFVVHGISYIYIMGITVGKLENKRRYFIILVSISAIFFGLGDYFFRVFAIKENYNYLNQLDSFHIILLSLITTPAIFHYFADGVIWTGKNEDMKKIFSNEVAV